jgi:hypothetical protein
VTIALLPRFARQPDDPLHERAGSVRGVRRGARRASGASRAGAPAAP